jgi:hypothetical protein
MQHKLDAYKDGDHTWITFCKVCGDENPTGDCSGKLISERKDNSLKTVDVEKRI